MTRYQGTRRYRLALEQGAWQVQSVIEEPNIFGGKWQGQKREGSGEQ
jgi:hypothetical protein